MLAPQRAQVAPEGVLCTEMKRAWQKFLPEKVCAHSVPMAGEASLAGKRLRCPARLVGQLDQQALRTRAC